VGGAFPIQPLQLQYRPARLGAVALSRGQREGTSQLHRNGHCCPARCPSYVMVPEATATHAAELLRQIRRRIVNPNS